MPTKRPRGASIIPEGMQSLLSEKDAQATCPAVYNGLKMKAKDPVKYSQIVQDLSMGLGFSKIAKARKVGLGTIAMVRAREKDLIEDGKVVVKSLTSVATIAALESIITKIEEDTIPPGVLPILFGILRDKEVRDQGEPTQKVEITHRVSIDEVRAKLVKMKRADPVEEVEEAHGSSVGDAGKP